MYTTTENPYKRKAQYNSFLNSFLKNKKKTMVIFYMQSQLDRNIIYKFMFLKIIVYSAVVQK